MEERFDAMMRALYVNPEYAGWEGVRVLWAEDLLALFPPPMWEEALAALEVPDSVKAMLRSDQLHPITFLVRGSAETGYRLVVGEYHLLVANAVQVLPEPRQEAVWERLNDFAERVRAAYEAAMVEAFERRTG
jgi:hypothetical protein